jgi:hypothetical protein
MKRFILLISLVILTSCNYFDKKKVYTKDLLEEELKSFNWNDVDEYPTFSSCDTSSGKLNKKKCFENTLRQFLNSSLASQNIVVTEDVNDTIILKITIDKYGAFSLDAIKCNAMTNKQIPQLDSLLTHSFDSLPKIFPAIKRSQQVATQFSLPIVVHIN